MEIQGFEPSTYTCKSLDLPAEPLQHQKVGFLVFDSTLKLRFHPQTQIPPSNSDLTLKLRFHPPFRANRAVVYRTNWEPRWYRRYYWAKSSCRLTQQSV
ncbi:hypothetical protein BLNAU_17905 [Blattamonas nauphoetae]|uniref:Uncharacterized protein n=1 Tax=Blattamonas nauphoetae TaxID=2049346 RepID=A0ABQ9X5S9_9EUKA|nr:hypothetical protein BLNAU_17905 [Blattamonas nauphoetae]